MLAQQQRLMEEQKKKMEKAMKERQFQEQQKRLKQFTAIGGRKMDVDSYMKSIVGGPDPPQQQKHGTPGNPGMSGMPGMGMVPGTHAGAAYTGAQIQNTQGMEITIE